MAQLMKRSNEPWMVILVIVLVVAILGAMFMMTFRSDTKVPVPSFSITQNSDLPGEEIIRGASTDNELVATITDHVGATTTVYGQYHGVNHIWIHFDNEEAKRRGAHLVLTITRDDGEQQVYNFDESRASAYVNVEGLPYGETVYTIVAENVGGRIEKTLRVTKGSHRAACDASSTYRTHEYCSHFYETENDAPTKPWNSGHSGVSSGAHGACVHHEAGRCWDDLEMEAYSQGQYDKHYGHYGGSYNEDDDCNAACRDILMDAYDEGYGDE